MTDNLERALGRVEGKLDALLARTDAADAEKRRLDGRIGKLEHDSTSAKATAGVISAIVAVVGGAIAHYIK